MGKSARGSERGARVLLPNVKNAWVYLPPKPHGRTVLARTCHTCGILRQECEYYDKGHECASCHLAAERRSRWDDAQAAGVPVSLYHRSAVLLAATCRTCHRFLSAAEFYESNGMRVTTRCQECARRAYLEAQATSRAVAHHHGYQWTGPEMEIAERPEFTAKQVAEMLGRTVNAVNGMRHKIKHDPKVGRVLGPQP